MTGTTRQPKVSKTHETASQKAGTAISQIQTPFRTMPPPKTRTKANSHSTRRPASGTHQFHSHSRPPTCCMHVHQQQSQTCKTGKPPALREVKHPHRDRTSVSRPPSTEQGVLSQFSSYSEEIEHFTRDPCKSHLKSCFQSTKHAPKKQEVNTCTNCEHSYGMEHAEHFSAPMEMCMDDHLTHTTERIQQQHLQDKTYDQNCLTHNISPDFNFSHAEFPPGMENTPSFLGKQFLQGKETITHPDMENMPVLPWNQSIQENEKNVHNKETLSTSLKTDTNMNANMDTNHIAHRYRHIGKEVHLLSEPSELRPPEETQKFNSTHIQQPRQEYS